MTQKSADVRGKRAVLGIDAAWTLVQPSGVAVAVESTGGWRLAGVAPSYERFYSLLDSIPQTSLRPLGSEADAARLITCASHLCGGGINLVAVDMPLARTPIRGRREADQAVSTAYGARQCSTHTPSALRPGPVGEKLRDALAAVGYLLLTTGIAPRGLIEVYPHPALVELARSAAAALQVDQGQKILADGHAVRAARTPASRVAKNSRSSRKGNTRRLRSPAPTICFCE